MAGQRKGGNVRIGIVSFITLVSVLLLAVLAVLCVVTANATSATVSREASSVTSLYEVDSFGQALLSQVDAQLAQSKAAGMGKATAAARVQSTLEASKARALELSGVDAEGANLSVEASVSGATLSFTVSTESGRTLEAAVLINDDLSYTVSAWKMTTAQSQPEQNLWGGAGTGASSSTTGSAASSTAGNTGSSSTSSATGTKN